MVLPAEAEGCPEFFQGQLGQAELEDGEEIGENRAMLLRLQWKYTILVHIIYNFNEKDTNHT